MENAKFAITSLVVAGCTLLRNFFKSKGFCFGSVIFAQPFSCMESVVVFARNLYDEYFEIYS